MERCPGDLVQRISSFFSWYSQQRSTTIVANATIDEREREGLESDHVRRLDSIARVFSRRYLVVLGGRNRLRD